MGSFGAVCGDGGRGLIIFIERVSDALANFLNSQELKDFLVMVEDIGNGAILTDQHMVELQKRFSLTDEDMEMLRQEMFDTNPLLREIADNLGFEDASPETLQDMAEGFALIANGVEPLPEDLSGMTDEARNFITSVMESQNPMEVYGDKLANLGTIAENTSASLNETGRSISEGIIKGMEDADVETASQGLFGRIITKVKELFGIHSPSTVMAEIGTFIIQGLFNGINSLVESVTAIWQSMKETAAGIWEKVKTTLSGTWENIKTTAAAVWNTITTTLKGIWEKIKTTVTTVFDGIKTKLQGVWEGVKSTVERVWNNISTKITGVIDTVKQKIEGFVEKINSAIRAVKDFLSSGYEKIKGTFSGGDSGSAYSGKQGVPCGAGRPEARDEHRGPA